MIPVSLPVSCLVAWLPSVAITFGLISAICSKSHGSHCELLLGQRVAVPRRAALERVRDVDVRTSQPDAGEQLVEELPGLADERDALLVFVETGRLAHEHQIRVRVAVAEHDLRPALRSAHRVQTEASFPERVELHRRGV